MTRFRRFSFTTTSQSASARSSSPPPGLRNSWNLLGGDITLRPTMWASVTIRLASSYTIVSSAVALVLYGCFLLGLRVDVIEEHDGNDMAPAVGPVRSSTTACPLNLGLILPEPRVAGVGGDRGGAVDIQLRRGDVHRLIRLRRSPGFARPFPSRLASAAAYHCRGIGFGPPEGGWVARSCGRRSRLQLLRGDSHGHRLGIDHDAAVVHRRRRSRDRPVTA